MHCIVDRGNTKTKIYFFKHGELIHSFGFLNDDIAAIADCIAAHKIDKGLISSSSDIPALFLQNTFNILSSETELPIKLAYKTPNTLGTDRIALAVGAYALYPNQACLILSLGTCITADILTEDGVFVGGIIAPGVHMRRIAMHEQTANLPLLSVESLKKPPLIGKTTEESMASGIIHATEAEINGLIQRFESIYNDLTVILTGGDMDLFEFHAKNEIFAQPNLQAIGLNRILTEHAS